VKSISSVEKEDPKFQSPKRVILLNSRKSISNSVLLGNSQHTRNISCDNSKLSEIKKQRDLSATLARLARTIHFETTNPAPAEPTYITKNEPAA